MNPTEMKVLMISSDKNILVPGSLVNLRMIEYSSLVGELHIVLLSKKTDKLSPSELNKKLFVYPTNSISRFLYPFDAGGLGKKIAYDKKFVRGNSLITTQDPFESGWAGLSIKNKWRLPLEVQLHTDPFAPHFFGALNAIRKIIGNRVIKKADSIRVVSETLAQKIKEKYDIDSKKINVLPIYIETEKINKGQISFDLHSRFGWHFVLLTVARLTPEKNISFALSVLKKVVEKFPSTGLVIVGSGPLEETLKKQASKMGLENNVSFEGWQTDLYSYYHTANAYIQTSKFEGYGLSLIEAGLSGLPIVTTSVGIADELESGKDAYIGFQGDIRYFTEAVIDLIENNQARENLRVNMKNKLQNKLILKENYLKMLQDNWAQTSKHIA